MCFAGGFLFFYFFFCRSLICLFFRSALPRREVSITTSHTSKVAGGEEVKRVRDTAFVRRTKSVVRTENRKFISSTFWFGCFHCFRTLIWNCLYNTYFSFIVIVWCKLFKTTQLLLQCPPLCLLSVFYWPTQFLCIFLLMSGSVITALCQVGFGIVVSPPSFQLGDPKQGETGTNKNEVTLISETGVEPKSLNT